MNTEKKSINKRNPTSQATAQAHSSAEPQPTAPQPTPEVARRIEELLQEQLYELGVNVKSLSPEDIAKSMKCHIDPENNMTYFWNNHAILDVMPEISYKNNAPSVIWRMFTKDDMPENTNNLDILD